MWEEMIEKLAEIKLEKEVITPETPELDMFDLAKVGIMPRDPVLGLGMIRQAVDDYIHEEFLKL